MTKYTSSIYTNIKKRKGSYVQKADVLIKKIQYLLTGKLQFNETFKSNQGKCMY